MINKSTHKKDLEGYTIHQEKFWACVDMAAPTDCWDWKRALNTGGYGLFTVKSPADVYEKTGRVYTQVLAHRAAAAESMVVLPHDYVMHKCDNRKCCNPDHLQVGTALDNLLDAKEKGRWNGPIRMLPR